MTATVGLYCYTGTDAATASGGTVAGIDFISADNSTNSLANRQANPITAGNNSYEKWLKLNVTGAPDNAVTNFLFWTDGGVDAETTMYAGTTATGVTPTASNSTIATTNATTFTSGAKGTWTAGTITTTGTIDRFLVLQLRTTASATAGNWTQETITYSYDET